jgi:hypothetical protein
MGLHGLLQGYFHLFHFMSLTYDALDAHYTWGLPQVIVVLIQGIQIYPQMNRFLIMFYFVTLVMIRIHAYQAYSKDPDFDPNVSPSVLKLKLVIILTEQIGIAVTFQSRSRLVFGRFQ